MSSCMTQNNFCAVALPSIITINNWLTHEQSIFMSNATPEEIQRDHLMILCQVELGESFSIPPADKPISELRFIPGSKNLRPFGLCSDEFTVPDDFDAPLPEDVLGAFEGR